MNIIRKQVYRQPDWQVVLAILGFHGVLFAIYIIMLPENAIIPIPGLIAMVVVGVLGLIGVCGIMATIETKAQLRILWERGIAVPRSDEPLEGSFKAITYTFAGAALASLVMGALLHNPLLITTALGTSLWFIALYVFGRDIEPFYRGLKTIEQAGTKNMP